MKSPQCKLVEENLRFYIDGEVNETIKTNIEFHLESCPDCSKKLKLYLAIVQSEKSIEPPQVPENLVPRLKDSLREELFQKPEKRLTFPGFHWRPQLRFAAAFAGMFAAFAFGAYMLFWGKNEIIKPPKGVPVETRITADMVMENAAASAILTAVMGR